MENKATIKWVNVEEELPEDGNTVLLLTDSGIIEGNIRDKEDRKWHFLTLDAHGCGCCAGPTDEVLFWSELPLLPESYKPDNDGRKTQ